MPLLLIQVKDAHFKAYPDWKWSNKEKRKESASSLTPRLSTTSDDGEDEDAHAALFDGKWWTVGLSRSHGAGCRVSFISLLCDTLTTKRWLWLDVMIWSYRIVTINFLLRQIWAHVKFATKCNYLRRVWSFELGACVYALFWSNEIFLRSVL